jgi:hemerythrin superfamily protein
MADVISLIKRDHRTMEKLFDKLEKDRKRRPEVLREVAVMLTAHSHAEEQKVYPAVAKEAGDKDDAEHGAEEHQKADKLLRRLQGLETSSKQFDKVLKEFVDAVKHHVEEEEGKVLPALKKAVTKKRLEELGRDFSAQRERELSRAQGTKRELYDEARRLDIKGRSKMAKDELVKAIEHEHAR